MMTETTKLTAETITSAQIRALRTEAGEAGDSAQVAVCNIALGNEEPVTTAAAWEDRFGGGGHSDSERKAIMAARTTEQAQQICADVINAARANEEG